MIYLNQSCICFCFQWCFWFKYDLDRSGTHPVRNNWCSNPWHSDHMYSAFHVSETLVLTIQTSWTCYKHAIFSSYVAFVLVTSQFYVGGILIADLLLMNGWKDSRWMDNNHDRSQFDGIIWQGVMKQRCIKIIMFYVFHISSNMTDGSWTRKTVIHQMYERWFLEDICYFLPSNNSWTKVTEMRTTFWHYETIFQLKTVHSSRSLWVTETTKGREYVWLYNTYPPNKK